MGANEQQQFMKHPKNTVRVAPVMN